MMFPEAVFAGIVVGVVAQCNAQPAQFVSVPIPLVHDLCAVHIRLCDLLFSDGHDIQSLQKTKLVMHMEGVLLGGGGEVTKRKRQNFKSFFVVLFAQVSF